MKKSESKLQSECYQWYNNNYCLKIHKPRGLMFSIPNELGGRNAIGTMMAKAIGLTAGVSDTIVILPSGKLLFVEFKTSTGRQSDKQKEFEKIVSELGFEYKIIRTFEEFKKMIVNPTHLKVGG